MNTHVCTHLIFRVTCRCVRSGAYSFDIQDATYTQSVLINGTVKLAIEILVKACFEHCVFVTRQWLSRQDMSGGVGVYLC